MDSLSAIGTLIISGYLAGAIVTTVSACIIELIAIIAE